MKVMPRRFGQFLLLGFGLNSITLIPIAHSAISEDDPLTSRSVIKSVQTKRSSKISMQEKKLNLHLAPVEESKKDWFLQANFDGGYGINAVGLKKHLAETKTEAPDWDGKPLIVAIIDSGYETSHPYLKKDLLKNKAEIAAEIAGANTPIDDDGNGFVNDFYGWNFIGSAKGHAQLKTNNGQESLIRTDLENKYNVSDATFEITRNYRTLNELIRSGRASNAAEKLRNTIQSKMAFKIDIELPTQIKNWTDKRIQLNKNVEEIKKALAVFNLKNSVDPKTIKLLETIYANDSAKNELVQKIKKIYSALIDEGKELEFKFPEDGTLQISNFQYRVGGYYGRVVNFYKRSLADYENHYYNAWLDERKKIDETSDRNLLYVSDIKAGNATPYGNNDIIGSNNRHGTHVAGIVKTVYNFGFEDTKKNIKFIFIRAVPNGDEHDKDVANAIIYAVDQGASIINMSFGKSYATYYAQDGQIQSGQDMVNEAIAYADSKGALLIHAAGNDSKNNDVTRNYPNAWFLDAANNVLRTPNMIDVGATTANENIIASFSNYGHASVDVFAPGEFIYSSVPGGLFDYARGTSMAAPVVAGIATFLKYYFPTATGSEIAQAITMSSLPIFKMVSQGEGEDAVVIPFHQASRSGGVVSMLESFIKLKNMMELKKVKIPGPDVDGIPNDVRPKKISTSSPSQIAQG